MHRKSALGVKLFTSLDFSSPWPNKNLQCLAVLNYLTGGREPGKSLKQDVGVVKITLKEQYILQGYSHFGDWDKYRRDVTFHSTI